MHSEVNKRVLLTPYFTLIYYPRNLAYEMLTDGKALYFTAITSREYSYLIFIRFTKLILFLNPIYMKKSMIITSAVAGTIGLLAAVSTFAATSTGSTSFTE